jgi:hypothetical protein
MAQVMRDLSVMMLRFSQARLLFDEEAFDKLRRLRDIVRAYAKRDAKMRVSFAPLFEFFGRSAKTRREKQRKKTSTPPGKALSLVKAPVQKPAGEHL